MKLLCIADEECKALWDYYTPDKIEGVARRRGPSPMILSRLLVWTA